MREWDRDVAVLRVEVPDSVVPEPLRQGLAALAAGVAGDLGIPVPTLRYFQAAVLDTLDDLAEAKRFLRFAGTRCLETPDYEPSACLEITHAALAGLGGFTLPADPHSIWVRAEGEATDMAEVVRHETRHLYQFWLRAALEEVMTTRLQADAEVRESYEADAEDYAFATRDPDEDEDEDGGAPAMRAVSDAIRRAWEQWHALVHPLYTTRADGHTTQTTYPTSHGTDWLWATAYANVGP